MMRRSMVCASGLAALAALALATGCGSSGGVSSAVGGTSAPWLVLDLGDGSVSAHGAAPDLSLGEYRDRLIAFRRLGPGRIAVGSEAGSWAHQDDELAGTAGHGVCYMAALELTRAQWRRLAGTEPWLGTFPDPGDAGDLPAVCLSATAVGRVLGAWRGREATTRLRLPTATEWEAAARPAGSGLFPWGDDHEIATAAAWAWTADTGASAGPRAVGTLRGDARGLHDVCGNAWELTADGTLRGGGWCDPLSLARTANHQDILADTPHEGAGARLCLVP